MKHSTAIIALTVNMLLGPLLAHGTALYLKDPEAIGKIVDAHTQGNSDDGSYYTKYGAIYESSGYYHLFYYGSGPEHFIMGELPLLPWVNDELLTDQINYTFLEKPATVVDRWSEAHFNKAHPWFTSEVLLPAYQDGSGNWNVQQATADSSLVRLGDYFYLFFESWSELDANDEPANLAIYVARRDASSFSVEDALHPDIGPNEDWEIWGKHNTTLGWYSTDHNLTNDNEWIPIVTSKHSDSDDAWGCGGPSAVIDPTDQDNIKLFYLDVKWLDQTPPSGVRTLVVDISDTYLEEDNPKSDLNSGSSIVLPGWPEHTGKVYYDTSSLQYIQFYLANDGPDAGVDDEIKIRTAAKNSPTSWSSATTAASVPSDFYYTEVAPLGEDYNVRIACDFKGHVTSFGSPEYIFTMTISNGVVDGPWDERTVEDPQNCNGEVGDCEVNSVQELFAFKAKLTTSSSGDHSLSLGDINHEYNGAEIDVTLNCEQDDAYFVYISNDIYDEYWNSGGYAIDYYFPSSNYSKVKIDGGSSQGEYWVGFWVWNDPGNFGVGRRT